MTDIPSSIGHPQINKWWFIGGGTAIAAVYVIYKRKSSSSAADAAAAAAVPATPTTTDPNAVDPSTGVPYADESDNFLTGNGTALGSPYGALGGLSLNPLTGQYEATGAASTSTVPTDNATWAQQATNYLTTSLGYDEQTVSTALAAYLTGNEVTTAQSPIVEAALAYKGNPPVGVPAPVVSTNGGQTSVNPAVSGWSQPPAGTHYLHNSVSGEVDQIWPDGTTIHLTPFQYAALGSPKFSSYKGGASTIPFVSGQPGYNAPAAPTAPITLPGVVVKS